MKTATNNQAPKEHTYRGHRIVKGISYWRTNDWHYKTLKDAKAAIDRHLADEEAQVEFEATEKVRADEEAWLAADRAWMEGLVENAKNGRVPIIKV